MLCRLRDGHTVEVLNRRHQEFWTELLMLTQQSSLRLAYGLELTTSMCYLVEVIFIFKEVNKTIIMVRRGKKILVLRSISCDIKEN